MSIRNALDDIIYAQRTVQDAAPDLADEVIRLRKWQQEALPYLRIALQKLKPNPLDFVHFDESIADLDRLIAEAQGD